MRFTKLVAMLGLIASGAWAQSGEDLMRESLRRHASPSHVYEEEALVLTDREGRHTVRTLRHYALREGGEQRSLRVIETPADARGAAIYVERTAAGETRRSAAPASPVFGSVFSVADLDEERIERFRYEREGSQDLERVPHHVLRALPAAGDGRHAGAGERRIYLRKDNLFVSRIDYLGADGRTEKRLSFRDPQPDEAGAWHAGMLLMEDLQDGSRALLKVERRVHSPDYVPKSVFAGLRAP